MAESYLSKRAAVRERLEQQAESERSLPCRVCSECDGHHHTSTEYAEFDEQSAGRNKQERAVVDATSALLRGDDE